MQGASCAKASTHTHSRNTITRYYINKRHKNETQKYSTRMLRLQIKLQIRYENNKSYLRFILFKRISLAILTSKKLRQLYKLQSGPTSHEVSNSKQALGQTMWHIQTTFRLCGRVNTKKKKICFEAVCHVDISFAFYLNETWAQLRSNTFTTYRGKDR